MFKLLIAFVVGLIASNTAFAQDANRSDDETQQSSGVPEPTGKSLTEKASYLLGYNFMSSFKEREIDVDLDRLIAGLQDALQDKELDMSEEEIQAVEIAFQRVIVKKEQEMFKKAADDNMRSGEAFLKENALKEGVKEFESGLQIKVVKSGSGPIPKVSDKVKVHYRGTFPDGTEFEKTEDEPITMPVGGVIRGMSEALQKMKVGDKWMLYIPGNLAYGIDGFPPAIGPNQALVFEVELVEIAGQ